MPKDEKITRKLAFYKAQRKRGKTNEEAKKLWDAKQAQEAAEKARVEAEAKAAKEAEEKAKKEAADKAKAEADEKEKTKQE